MELTLRSLSCADAERVSRSLEKLSRHDTRNWAVTGGLALEAFSLHVGAEPCVRPLNDLDFVAFAFEQLPQSLSEDFLFRHIHPQAAPGQVMLQLIDPEAALRIDVFRASQGTMHRAIHLAPPEPAMYIVSLEDLVARGARVVLSLAEGIPVPSKHARDYLFAAGLADQRRVETAWQDHRKPEHPMTFREADALLRDLVRTQAHLLITPSYSKDPGEVCPRCAPTGALQLADPRLVLSLLGYC